MSRGASTLRSYNPSSHNYLNRNTLGTSVVHFGRFHAELDQKNAADLEMILDTMIQGLRMDNFDKLTDEEKQEQLANFDALELLDLVKEISQELSIVKLENHFLIDFLEKNDAKLLIGLAHRRAQAIQTATQQYGRDRASVSGAGSRSMSKVSNLSSDTSSKRSISKRDVTSIAQFQMHKADFQLNFRAKTDMAEKTATEIMKEVHVIESQAKQQLKLLGSEIEELHYTCEETEETTKNFELHFLRDYRDIRFLETATEKQLERKFRKFINNWIKNARALLGTMRLRITSIQELCQQQRNDLLTKADLSGILGAVDFEQLIIKRGLLLASLDDKNAHMVGLKAVTGKASLAMSEEKQLMIMTENESKRLSNKTIDVIKNINKLEKEAVSVENDNYKDEQVLHQLRDQLSKYEAPSVNEYIERKEEVLALEKEEKMLQRKLFISRMKLKNVMKKCKRH